MGRTEAMLAAALASVRRGRQVFVVVHRVRMARYCEALLFQELGASRGEIRSACFLSLEGAGRNLRGRRDVDVFVDHTYWVQQSGPDVEAKRELGIALERIKKTGKVFGD